MFEIVEHINTDTGRIMYEVVENDNFKFKNLGWFQNKAMAENYIERINTDYEDD